MQTWADRINVYRCLDCRKSFNPRYGELTCPTCFQEETKKLLRLPPPNKNIYSELSSQDISDVKKWLMDNRLTYEDFEARIVACTIFFRRHHPKKLDLKKYRIGRLIRESGAYRIPRTKSVC